MWSVMSCCRNSSTGLREGSLIGCFAYMHTQTPDTEHNFRSYKRWYYE
jgi:hypothetical protein